MNFDFKPLFFKTFYKLNNSFYLLPSIEFYYRKDEFLETGVYTPAYGIDIRWFVWGFKYIVQQGY
jgi:hypothetical protein